MILEFSNPIEINQYLQSKGNEEKLSYLTQKFSQTLQAKCISFQTDEDRIHQDHLVELELSQSKINSSKSQNLEIIEQNNHHDFKLQRKKVWVRFCINIGRLSPGL